MKNLISAFFVICISLFLTACSFRVPFVIENQSGKPISIKYKFKQWNNRSNPFLRDLSKESDENVWMEIPKENLKIDEENQTIEVTLTQNFALQIQSIDPFWKDAERYEHFYIKTLEINGENGSIKAEGNQVVELFQPQKSGFGFIGPREKAYVLYYKESKNVSTTK